MQPFLVIGRNKGSLSGCLYYWSNRLNNKGVLIVEPMQPEKVSKVAKIKAYLKTQLLFLVVFIVFTCICLVWQLHGVIDFMSPMSLLEASCSNATPKDTRIALVSAISLLLFACCVVVFQIIRNFIGCLLLLGGVDDEPDDNSYELDPVVYVAMLCAPMASIIYMLFSPHSSYEGYACTLIKFL